MARFMGATQLVFTVTDLSSYAQVTPAQPRLLPARQLRKICFQRARLDRFQCLAQSHLCLVSEPVSRSQPLGGFVSLCDCFSSRTSSQQRRAVRSRKTSVTAQVTQCCLLSLYFVLLPALRAQLLAAAL